MSKLRKILWPFSVLYDGVTKARNLAFAKGVLAQQAYPFPVISVGNLSTGGTGKSPMVAHILENFAEEQCAVVSRGYGRKTKGFVEVLVNKKASEVGDEPLQLKRKFPGATVVVSENRNEALEWIERNKSFIKQVILDDAYQHRYVARSCNILLTTFQAPFYKDLILPAGNLRESRSGASRADVIVITKCPATLTKGNAKEISKEVKQYSDAPVFFSTIRYTGISNALGEKPKTNLPIHLITGIANHKLLVKQLKKAFTLKKHFNFPDHHTFTSTEIELFRAILRNPKNQLVTTRKDFQRLTEHLPKELIENIFVQDIGIEILFDEQHLFLQKITAN